MQILFRTDASSTIGKGHVMRCLSLAIELRENGGTCKFICRAHDGNLINRITEEGFEVATLPLHSYNPRSPNHDSGNHIHLSCLGTDWETDANETILALGNKPVDWLIVDHYALDFRWESMLRKVARRIMVVDDLADRDHDCDLLLDQNLIADMEVRYDTRVPSQCACLLGPEFALLHPEYSELRGRTAPRSGPIRRILVSFGGLDHHGRTALAVESILSTNGQDIILD
ncbi:MAG: UDP-2,4-diacetamido-2,4,6-trideoxy-beta-L-altropyranose hydrolase, partial [Gammaproteobacteria bacterium]